MIVHLTAEAEADIEGIVDFIARESPQRALTFVRAFRDTYLSLGDARLVTLPGPLFCTRDRVGERGPGQGRMTGQAFMRPPPWWGPRAARQ